MPAPATPDATETSARPRVLLTGASGFLGDRLLQRLLDQGHEVVAISSRPRASTDPRVRWEQVDFTRDEAADPAHWQGLLQKHQIGAVLNNAGISEEDPARGITFDRVNVQAVSALAEAAEAHGVSRFVQISTQGAGLPGAENFGYAGSKKRAEQAIMAREGLDWTIVRPDIIYSPQGWGHKMSLDEIAALPVVPILGTGRETLQPIHVDDAAHAADLVSAPAAGARHKVLDAVGPEALTLPQIYRFLKAQRGETYRAVPVPLALGEAFARHYPIGAANADFVGMLRAQGQMEGEHDPGPFAALTGAPLRTMGQAYAADPNPKFKDSPMRDFAGKVMAAPQKLALVARDVMGQMGQAVAQSTRRFLQRQPKGPEMEAAAAGPKPEAPAARLPERRR